MGSMVSIYESLLRITDSAIPNYVLLLAQLKLTNVNHNSDYFLADLILANF